MVPAHYNLCDLKRVVIYGTANGDLIRLMRSVVGTRRAGLEVDHGTVPVLTALRQATHAQHLALEAGSDIEARLRDVATRRDMVARFLDLHERVEAITAGYISEIATFGCALPGRARLIHSDLRQLGVRPSPPIAVSPAASFGEALGWLYVAEGSMLGGRVMRRAMTAKGIDQEGLGFLDPHGQDTGRQWREFLAMMELACSSGRARQVEVVTGACRAFELASRILIASQPVAISV